MGEFLGYWIHELRRIGVSDSEIYGNIIDSRDKFLRLKGLTGASYDKISQKKQCLEIYNTIQERLIWMVEDKPI